MSNQNIKSFEADYNSKFVGADGKEYYTFVLSTGSIDRHNEKVSVQGIDFTAFTSNPVCLYQHDREVVIGTWSNLKVQGGKLYGDLWLHEATDTSREVKLLIDLGVLKAVSVGYISIESTEEPIPADLKSQFVGSWKQTITNHTKSELLEVSIVTIPANKEAIRVKANQLLKYIEEPTVANNETIETISKMEIVEKVGKPISASNKSKIKKAHDKATEIQQELKDLIAEPDEDCEEPEIEFGGIQPHKSISLQEYKELKIVKLEIH